MIRVIIIKVGNNQYVQQQGLDRIKHCEVIKKKMADPDPLPREALQDN